jgi:hypothetical protein
MERIAVGQREVYFSLDYLSQVVDRHLERAAEGVLASVAVEGPHRREQFSVAREQYGIAFAIAALADERVYNANEWPIFTAWAALLIGAAVRAW